MNKVSLTTNLNIEKFSHHFAFPHEARCGHEKKISSANSKYIEITIHWGRGRSGLKKQYEYKILKVWLYFNTALIIFKKKAGNYTQ